MRSGKQSLTEKVRCVEEARSIFSKCRQDDECTAAAKVDLTWRIVKCTESLAQYKLGNESLGDNLFVKAMGGFRESG